VCLCVRTDGPVSLLPSEIEICDIEDEIFESEVQRRERELMQVRVQSLCVHTPHVYISMCTHRTCMSLCVHTLHVYSLYEYTPHLCSRHFLLSVCGNERRTAWRERKSMPMTVCVCVCMCVCVCTDGYRSRDHIRRPTRAAIRGRRI
jgi:hypothetical protein